MTRRRAALARAAVALGLAAACTAALPAGPSVAWRTLPLVDGGTLEPARLQGGPVIVVFWATWCGFCERHNARVERLHRSLQGAAPQIVGVAIDGDTASVGRLVRQRGWTFPVTVDDGSLRRQFTPRRLVPMTCLVDAGGQVRQCIPGEMAEDDVLSLARPPRS